MPADVLTLQRVVAADPETVWEAWTTEAGLARWWWAHLPGTTYAVDLRVGGAYRIEAAALAIGVAGEYLAIEPPRRLVSTWVWLEAGVPGETEQVEVTFTGVAAGTRVDLRHTGPWTTSEAAENYRVGWTVVLDALEALSATSRSPATRPRSG